MFDVDNDLSEQIRQITEGRFSDDEIFIRETRRENGDVRRDIVTDSGRTLSEVTPDGKELRKGGYSQKRFPGDSIKKDKTAGPGEVDVESLRENLGRQLVREEKAALTDTITAPEDQSVSVRKRL